MTEKTMVGLNMRIDRTLKDKFKVWCDVRNFSMNKLVVIFMEKVIADEKLPFVIEGDIEIKRAGRGEADEARVSFLIEKEVKEKFKDIVKDKYGMDMAIVVKMFMGYCIKYKKLPFKL